ncbi:alpha/beta fold hydrolase [Nocardioides speluncae]|uniref:alpha/beta hydrolase family protein n=1 Tax=Nocardioides speluncae TaxID=2670337 RepID=UPI00137B2509|nr:alpha/beta fold hydrolase [Nocardioides speluncae]
MTPDSVVLDRAEGTSFQLTVHAAADAAAPVFLLQPAMGTKAGYYGRLATALQLAGLTAVVSELRGHEASGGRHASRGYDFGYDEMVNEDLAQAVAAVRDRFPDAALHLLGHSLGGQLCSLYAAQHPGEVDGLVLIASAAVHWRHYGWPFLPLSQFFGFTAKAVGHFPGKRVGFAGREARTVMADWARVARTGRFATGSPRVDREDELAKVDVPVLAISLTGDTFAPRRAVDALADKLTGAEVTRLHLTPDEPTDHFKWARRPQTVVPAIVDWLG